MTDTEIKEDLKEIKDRLLAIESAIQNLQQDLSQQRIIDRGAMTKALSDLRALIANLH